MRTGCHHMMVRETNKITNLKPVSFITHFKCWLANLIDIRNIFVLESFQAVK